LCRGSAAAMYPCPSSPPPASPSPPIASSQCEWDAPPSRGQNRFWQARYAAWSRLSRYHWANTADTRQIRTLAWAGHFCASR
jgi:hypothetical protein